VTDSEVRRQIIPYPKSLIEQHAIVAKFDELSKETQRLEAIYQQKLDALEELKKSMLHQAFSGELKEKNYEQRRP
jgi:type I restriction enzyme S subunit